MRILIAIPVHNERTHVESVLARVKKQGYDILCIDDGSIDGTGELLAARSDIHVVRHPRNRGYGASIISAFKFAAKHGYDWVITMDCDEQHEPESIPSFVRLIETDEYDLISGTRYSDLSLGDDIAPGDRRAINATITTTLNDLFDWKLTDGFCGYKAHRVSAMIDLKLDEAGYAFPLQLWPRVYGAQLRMVELPVRRIYNDPNRTFGGDLDDAKKRLEHYLSILKRELRRLKRKKLPAGDAVASECCCCGTTCESCEI